MGIMKFIFKHILKFPLTCDFMGVKISKCYCSYSYEYFFNQTFFSTFIVVVLINVADRNFEITN